MITCNLNGCNKCVFFSKLNERGWIVVQSIALFQSADWVHASSIAVMLAERAPFMWIYVPKIKDRAQDR